MKEELTNRIYDQGFKVGTLPSVRRPETQASISKPLVAKLQNTLSQEHNVYSK